MFHCVACIILCYVVHALSIDRPSLCYSCVALFYVVHALICVCSVPIDHNECHEYNIMTVIHNNHYVLL